MEFRHPKASEKEKQEAALNFQKFKERKEQEKRAAREAEAKKELTQRPFKDLLNILVTTDIAA